jgi:hypothetical protein
MKTYFMVFRVKPTEDNEQYQLVEGALAHFWVVEDDPQCAYAQAEFYLKKYDWIIEDLDTFPVEVAKKEFEGKDLGIEYFQKAQNEGIAFVLAAWSKDKKTTAGPLEVKPSSKFDLSKFLMKQKQLRNKGRCLHFDGDHRCKEIINAHSIQKNQSLEALSENGHVYRLSPDFGSVKKNKGLVSFEKCGINQVSTFLGFCKRHDNDLFEPIDNFPLIPTDLQVLLYAYRSLCREVFVNENALGLYENLLVDIPDSNPIKEFFMDMKSGTEFGLKNLLRHKEEYDNSLRCKAYSDIRYVLFSTDQNPFIAFSGLLYPDFDFMGRQLQNLGDHTQKLDLITFCSAPVESGWSVLFSWHNTSSKTCQEFMRSLATIMYDGERLGDLLFRMAISNCENLAIAPKWWESLRDDHKKHISAMANIRANIFSQTRPTYLLKGLEGIAPWEFVSVIDNME